MEKYVLLRGKVVGKWYDFDKRAHYHILVNAVREGKEAEEYDASINIGSILEDKDDGILSSNLQVYYNNDYSYNQTILDRMLLQKRGLTKGSKDLCLDYVRMSLFPHGEMKPIKGIDREKIFLTGIIERHVLESQESDRHEVFIFGRLYENKKGVHDIHMNQGSIDRYRSSDAPYSDGGIFFYDMILKKWAAIFIAFTTQSLKIENKIK